LLIAEDWVLRFRQMVKRGQRRAASSIRRRSAAWSSLLDWTFSVKATSVCIVDDTGKIVREVNVASEPEALLTNPA
jgi:hypothetical protein